LPRRIAFRDFFFFLFLLLLFILLFLFRPWPCAFCPVFSSFWGNVLCSLRLWETIVLGVMPLLLHFLDGGFIVLWLRPSSSDDGEIASVSFVLCSPVVLLEKRCPWRNAAVLSALMPDVLCFVLAVLARHYER